MITGMRRVHLVGIGGSGMSGIAVVLLNLKCEVSGSDIQDSPLLERLRSDGASIFLGHAAENVKGADVVVFSNAIARDNPELLAASDLGIPVIPRAEMLAGLMRMTKCGVAVAGTHGKTSTSSMIAEILRTAGLDPTVIVGGAVDDRGSGGRLGSGNILVAEACESDGTFLKLDPTIAVITSLEREHMDYYRSEAQLFEAFVTFANNVPFYGCVVMCLDQPNLQMLIPKIKRRLMTYGMTTQSDLTAAEVRLDCFTSRFQVHRREKAGRRLLGEVSLNSPGMFSVQNALAAIAVALELGVDFEKIQAGLARFKRAGRRFELKGTPGDVMIVIDYGHHPTEIRETLKAAKAGWKRRILVAFQPHRFSRTQDLLRDFFTIFNDADFLVITPIYPAGESPIEGIDSKLIFEGVKRMGHKAVHLVEGKLEATELLAKESRAGDMILILGAGDIHTIGDALLEKLNHNIRR
ncbi:UDP-N-acetylmuramate--L-alanine ligase [bacterium]|nr:UDP-N-acetylmuramate--L-alanine ligase [bacterium]